MELHGAGVLGPVVQTVFRRGISGIACTSWGWCRKTRNGEGTPCVLLPWRPYLLTPWSLGVPVSWRPCVYGLRRLGVEVSVLRWVPVSVSVGGVVFRCSGCAPFTGWPEVFLIPQWVNDPRFAGGVTSAVPGAGVLLSRSSRIVQVGAPCSVGLGVRYDFELRQAVVTAECAIASGS